MGSLLTILYILGKEYVCVLRLHSAIESEVQLAKVKNETKYTTITICKPYEAVSVSIRQWIRWLERYFNDLP